jgi:hypothetical protein
MRHAHARRMFETALNTLALASLMRRIGPRRLVRVAALATEGYLGESSRGRRRRTDRGRR